MKQLLAFAVAFTLLAACPLQGDVAGPPTSGIDQANFDKTVRPQDDLFRAVNGAWLARTEIPADRSDYGAFTVLARSSREGSAHDHRGLRRCQGQSARFGKAEDRGHVRIVHGRSAGRSNSA